MVDQRVSLAFDGLELAMMTEEDEIPAPMILVPVEEPVSLESVRRVSITTAGPEFKHIASGVVFQSTDEPGIVVCYDVGAEACGEAFGPNHLRDVKRDGVRASVFVVEGEDLAGRVLAPQPILSDSALRYWTSTAFKLRPAWAAAKVAQLTSTGVG